ncbi:MAG: hypothetical protein RLZZ15_1040 [Verrucomicrobiota bacterium]|jgi:TonB-dependent receptor
MWLRGLAVLLALGAASARAADSAVVSGTVNNSATGNLLQGARVELPALGRTALADSTGRYVLGELPPGTHELVATYTGLDPARASVTVTAGQRTVRDFELSSGVYKLDKFVVSGPREGGAAAITAQRNADNVKNVVAMDSFGNLPNMSAGELAIRLPGVAAGLDDEGNVTGLIVRGQGAANNRVTVDGGLIASTANLSRQFQTHSMTGAMFEQLEVIKGHTPDKTADSLGGTVNLVTRSPLSMKEKRRLTYSFSTRVAPSFTDQVKLRRDHPAHPLLNASYQEVFDVAGGERNLGVALNYFYSENVAGGFRTIRDFINVPNQPAYLYTWANQDFFNNRKQASVNAKVDFRVSPTTRLSLNTIYNDAFEPFNRLYEVTALTAQTVATLDAAGNPTGANTILPNANPFITEARALAGSIVRVNETMFSFFNRTRAVDLGGQHEWDRWKADWTASYSQATPHLGVASGGTLTLDNPGVGWRLDRSKDDRYPTFTQTGGPDIANIANYRPNGPLTARNNTRISKVKDLRGNASYLLPVEGRVSLKAGFDRREQNSGVTNNDRRWNYAGGTRPIAADPSLVTWMSERTGYRPAMFETASFINAGNVDPALWTEDNYFRESQKFINTRELKETATALYAMTQGKLGRFGFLGGVRKEKTDVDAFGYVRAHTLSTAAQQTADPAGSAQRDYAANGKTIRGRYDDNFPSVHLSYDLTQNLKARTSWSTSFGRAPFANLFPSETPNDTTKTLVINNPALKPQYAKEWDATLEYYFEPVGNLSVGWFRKDIRDYIVNNIDGGRVPAGAANGYNGDYFDYQIFTSANAGSATVNGWEASYQQQFTFLPGVLRTLSFAANYTYLRTHGVFAGTTYLASNQVAGFIPQTGNLNLGWRYQALGVRVRTNYHGRYLNAFGGVTTPQRSQFRFARTVTDLGFSYQLRPNLQLTCDIANVTNEPQQFYRYVTSQMERTILNGVTWTVGVNGRF